MKITNTFQKPVSIIITLFLAITMTIVIPVFSFGQQNAADNDTIYLHTGSPLLLSKGEIAPLDPENPDVAAIVIDSRTLLPLRAISEYFGAKVSYDSADHKAIIEFAEKRFVFPINEAKYYIGDPSDQKEVVMDTKSIILNDRTMVPIRVISERILGLKVAYHDRVIAIGKTEIDLASNAVLFTQVKSKIGTALKARNIQELGLVLKESESITKALNDESSILDSAMEGVGPVAGEGGDEDAGSAGDFSRTEAQVEGIDEADIVKTDGQYIYIAGNNAARIVKTEGGKLSEAGSIKLLVDKTISEIYIDGDRLVLIGSRWEQNSSIAEDPEYSIMQSEAREKMYPSYINKNFTFIDVYDISDVTDPKFIKGHEMEGYYQTSRKNADIVYLISNNYAYGDIILPLMRDTVISDQAFSLKLDDVMIMPGRPAPGYIIISAMNIRNDQKTEVEAITAYGFTTYMNDSALYLASGHFVDSTMITKFSINETKIGYAGSGEVKGYLLNQFSMDEHKGNLRVATTTWENTSGIYVLDESLNIIGSVTGLAEGERIYSVRFMGDKGYIVTYRNIDPLFVFDLTDPAKPLKTGELKVPGFSNYLYPVEEDVILGIGADTYAIYRKDDQGKEIVVGTRQGGIKFSLFDVSDMGKPVELSKYIVGTNGSHTEAFYNHKAVMLDRNAKNVAVDASIVYVEMSWEYSSGAIVISFENNKLKLRDILDAAPAGAYGSYIPPGRRVIYIDDYLYYIQDGTIVSYRYANLDKIDSLILQ